MKLNCGGSGGISCLATFMMLSFIRRDLVELEVGGIFWFATFVMLSIGRGFKQLNFNFEIWTSNLKIYFTLSSNLCSNSWIFEFNAVISFSFFLILKQVILNTSLFLTEGDLWQQTGIFRKRAPQVNLEFQVLPEHRVDLTE